MKIAIIGAGTIGLATLKLLNNKKNNNTFVVVDKNKGLIKNLKNNINTNSNINHLEDNINILYTTGYINAIKNSDFVFICINADFSYETNELDTSNVENIIKLLKKNKYTNTIVIRTTVPIDFCTNQKMDNIVYYPEFLVEKYALEDVVHPDRIVFGINFNYYDKFKKLDHLIKDNLEDNCKMYYVMHYEGAAMVKLFSNAYLAMRVTFFNEVSKFIKNTNEYDDNRIQKIVIDAICYDYRIGNRYNNPSFGYGGKCLPKDIRQLISEYDSRGLDNKLFSSIDLLNTDGINKILIFINNNKGKVVLYDNETTIYTLVDKDGNRTPLIDNEKNIAMKTLKNYKYIIANRINKDVLNFSSKYKLKIITNDNSFNDLIKK
jgi:UDPglucose 6-dehydrogenase